MLLQPLNYVLEAANVYSLSQILYFGAYLSTLNKWKVTCSPPQGSYLNGFITHKGWSRSTVTTHLCAWWSSQWGNGKTSLSLSLSLSISISVSIQVALLAWLHTIQCCQSILILCYCQEKSCRCNGQKSPLLSDHWPCTDWGPGRGHNRVNAEVCY